MDVSPQLKNLTDLLFLPGFHSPTLALLYTPIFTWAGRYKTARDTFVLEIRTIDLSSVGSYPLLTSVTGLPADSLYIVACPADLGGVVLVTETGLLHIDQSGRVIGTSVNAWWSYATSIRADGQNEDRKLSLEGSKGIFVDGRDMLLVLKNGDVHQVRFEMEGRSVGAIKVDEQTSSFPPPSSMVIAGDKALFVGSSEGDCLLAKLELVREAKELSKTEEMEVDWDEDLYGDINEAMINGHKANAALTGPANVEVSTYDVLAGTGKIMDMQFGIALTDQAVSLTYAIWEISKPRQGRIPSLWPLVEEAKIQRSMFSDEVYPLRNDDDITKYKTQMESGFYRSRDKWHRSCLIYQIQSDQRCFSVQRGMLLGYVGGLIPG